MEKGNTYVGQDAHKASIKLAVLLPDATKPVEWSLPNENAAVRRMVRKVDRLAPGEVRFCYEAGPCGYALQRWMNRSMLPSAAQKRFAQDTLPRGELGVGSVIQDSTLR